MSEEEVGYSALEISIGDQDVSDTELYNEEFMENVNARYCKVLVELNGPLELLNCDFVLPKGGIDQADVCQDFR